MRNSSPILILYSLLTVLSLSACCNSDNGAITVRRDMINAGSAAVGDSVSATFRFRNNTDQAQTVTFLPECDCTTVSTESMKLAPNETGKLKVKVTVEQPGEFTKYVFVETAGSDGFFTVTVKSRGK